MSLKATVDTTITTTAAVTTNMLPVKDSSLIYSQVKAGSRMQQSILSCHLQLIALVVVDSMLG